MPDITIPKLNTVDVSYTLTEWCFADGELVPPGAVVAVIETSKVAEELVSEQGGVLHRLLDPPAECATGTVIGRLRGDQDDPLDVGVPPGPGRPDAAGAGPELVVTRAARELIDRYKLSAGQLHALGKKVITRADVAPLAGEPGRYRLPRAQQAVAAVVTASHRAIPAAFLVIKVEVAAAEAFQRRVAGRYHLRVGLPELLVKVTASLAGDFPLFFAAVGDDGTPTLPAGRPGVGITMDAGRGLRIPVVADPARASLVRVAEILAGFRAKALRGQFSHADLAGGNIAIALNDDDAIVAARPLIFPPNACMLTLCSTQEELALDHSGQVTVRRYVHLGLAYDHRLINGREAALFLGEIKEALEDTGRLDALTGDDDGE